LFLYCELFLFQISSEIEFQFFSSLASKVPKIKICLSPTDILRKVWDLSDQDKDGMLSFKEFCIAVYLMERHREHRPLPDTVTDAIWAEGTALPSTGQFAENPSAPAPQASAGIHPKETSLLFFYY
jgi:hypothetical protein